MHKLDLKLGISGDIGTETCTGHPGSWDNYDLDARTFSEWEIDLLTVSGCFANASMLQQGYRQFEEALNRTKRPIIYSIDWPLHDRNVNFSEVAAISQLWRVYHEVHDSFQSVMSVIDYVAAHPTIFRQFSGPGSWANLDVLAITGDSRLSLSQSKLQMAMWSIFPAPLLLTNNLKRMRKPLKDILIDRDVIAINQDFLGLPGKKMLNQDNLEVWIRKISPIHNKGSSGNTSYSFALVILNRELYGKPTAFKFTPKEFGMKHETGYQMKELFRKFEHNKHVMPNSTISVRVDASSVVFLKFELHSGRKEMEDRQIFGLASFFTQGDTGQLSESAIINKK
ncbi:hypothetical protein LSTR_LSTR017530 [Laodelphax striatellus]|uniref:Alpha-galactosidase n=1 Tax=Laodelphax striatellus TaxID=195883 RepID=A0A482XKQ8_LAOST|nr:hypothetical protein LSTR_LSTR017530 [Laodelphax striatellus]